jgi:hypothetical protein
MTVCATAAVVVQRLAAKRKSVILTQTSTPLPLMSDAIPASLHFLASKSLPVETNDTSFHFKSRFIEKRFGERETAQIRTNAFPKPCNFPLQPFGSGDLLSLRPYFSFHGGLSLQASEISRDGHDSERATTFLVGDGAIARIEAPIDLDSVPPLSVAHVIYSHVVVLTPEEWDSVKFLATAKNILSCYLPHALSNHPVLDANSLAGVRVGPAGGIAGSEDSSHAGFEVFVD